MTDVSEQRRDERRCVARAEILGEVSPSVDGENTDLIAAPGRIAVPANM